MPKQKVIFLYDYTGISAQPWLNAGYECWLIDGKHAPGVTRDGNIVKVGMWFDYQRIDEQAAEIAAMVGDAVLVGSYPECTDLAVSGSRWFEEKAKADPLFQEKAATLARLGEKVGNLLKCPWYAENPVSRLATLWRKPDFYFNPYEYGGYLPSDDTHPLYPLYIAARDAYPKKTGIWCGNGFEQPKTKPVDPEPGYSRQHSLLGGKSEKTKTIRSATPRGFAQAVFEQVC